MNKYDDYNFIILSKLSSFLNNNSNPITSKMINNLNTTQEDAFKYLLAACLDLDISNKDKDIYNLYFPLMIQKLDIKKYQDNLYYKNIKINNIKYKSWSFKYISYKPYEAFVYNDLEILEDGRIIPQIGYFDKEYKYPALLQNNREWMLITPNEIETMTSPINNAFGNVITYGLGLGNFTYMAHLKDNVKSVTIVEKDKDVIDLFNKYILKQFQYKEKIKIINEDAFNIANQKAFDYDYVFADLWHDPSDGINLYLKLKTLEKPNITYDYWIEKTLKIYIGGK